MYVSLKENYSDFEYKQAFNDGYVEGLANGKDIMEDTMIKFYYSEDEDKYLIGKRLENRYYAEVMYYPVQNEFVLAYGSSRWLPWGEPPHPKEPVEISFEEWLKGYCEQKNFI